MSALAITLTTSPPTLSVENKTNNQGSLLILDHDLSIFTNYLLIISYLNGI